MKVSTRTLKTVNMVLKELKTAREKFSTWPTDPMHSLGVLNEEVGELNKAVLQAVYDASEYDQHRASDLLQSVEDEAVQVAAMAIRFIENLNKYQYVRSDMHIDEEVAE